MDEPNPIKRFGQSSVYIVGTAGAGIVLPVWLLLASKSIRKVIDSHGVISFAVLLGVAVVSLLWTERLIASRHEARRERDALKAELTAARDEARRERDTLMDESRGKQAVLKSALATAKQELEAPSARDIALFKQFEQEFPAVGGPLQYLRETFNGKQWPLKALEKLDAFQETWRYGHTFDDPEVESAREALWTKVDHFTTLLANEGDLVNDDPPVARLIEGRHRPGGRQEWEDVRRRLLDGAKTTVEAHEELVRVGRKRRL